jgi:Uma2 family endonuclease
MVVQRSRSVRFNYTDHRSTPEDHRRHEIVDGALIVTPTPRFRHQRVALNLMVVLETLARAHELGQVVGPITVHLQDDLVLEPDVAFIARERLGIADPDGDVHAPPDLVVEVLSPTTATYDRNLKRKRYLDEGVPELWIVDADEHTIAVWRAGSDEPEVVRDTLVWTVGDRRLQIALAEVFRS